MAALVLIFRYIFTVRERLDPEERLKGSSEELLLAFSDQHLRALMPPPRLPPASAAAAARAFDIAFALLGCQVFAPFFVVASALIKLEEGSPSSSGGRPERARSGSIFFIESGARRGSTRSSSPPRSSST
jgi:hypothetical protein